MSFLSSMKSAEMRWLCLHIAERRTSFLPGMVFLAVVGASGQGIFNMLDARHTEAQGIEGKQDGGILQKVVESGWTPFKVLTDENYADMVRERILKLDAEIAVAKDEMKRIEDSSLEPVENARK